MRSLSHIIDIIAKINESINELKKKDEKNSCDDVKDGTDISLKKTCKKRLL